MNKEIIKGIIIGVISSLIASGILYFFTQILLWNYSIPVWIWLAVTVGGYISYKTIRCIMFKKKLKEILSEYREGGIGDSFSYTWEYRKSDGPYNVYGHEPYCIKIKEETKELLSRSDTLVFSGHTVSEDILKRYIQLHIVYMLNKKLQRYLTPTLEFLNEAQNSQRHEIVKF